MIIQRISSRVLIGLIIFHVIFVGISITAAVGMSRYYVHNIALSEIVLLDLFIAVINGLGIYLEGKELLRRKRG